MWTVHVGRGKGHAYTDPLEKGRIEAVLRAGARAMGLGRFGLRKDNKLVAYGQMLPASEDVRHYVPVVTWVRCYGCLDRRTDTDQHSCMEENDGQA